jgi:AcrR family transcriptional regulator
VRHKRASGGSRERILQAAIEEFAANGFAGARIDRICRKADINVRMLYHFFGSKRGLLKAVLSEIFMRRQVELAASPKRLGALLRLYLHGYSVDRRRVRLLEWEALEFGLGKAPYELTNLEVRQEVTRRRIEAIRELQKDGGAPRGIDAELLYVMFVALTIYPMSFPQSVWVATGEDVDSEAFQARYASALAKLARLLGGEK